MNLLTCALSIGISLILSKGARASSTSTTSLSSTASDSESSSSSSSSSSTSAVYASRTISTPSIALPSSVVGLPTQIYQINSQRPKMINQINMQRSGLKQPLLCQDSMLTSIAQQHANNMAALDDLEHDLPCNSEAIPVQFCKSSQRLARFGQAAENIVALAGNDGSAKSAMAQFNADPLQFSTMMNPDYLYVGVGMAMNAVSGKYYWVQVLSAGNYQGVSCTLSPTVIVLNALNQTSTTVQPMSGLNMVTYPQGITNDNNNSKQNLFCTLIPFAHGTGTAVLSLGKLPYPTITIVPSNSSSMMAVKASGIIKAFNAALSKAGASIVGPSAIPMIPMQVIPSTESTTPTMSLNSSFDVASMLFTVTPTDSAQMSAMAMMSTMITDPSMSAAVAQIMMLARPTSTSVSS